MKMKLVLKTVFLIGVIFTTSSAKAQIQHSLVNGGMNGEHKYVVNGLTPSQPGAFFSYLWWFGDNGFQFVSSPSYVHGYRYAPDTCQMLLIATENYGTGGPPPMMPYRVETYTTSGSQSPVLQPGNSLYMQHYRNAVPNDTMYLILSYKNITSQTPESGTLRLDLDPQLQILDNLISNHPEFHPNGEQKTSGIAEWQFSNLKYDQERNILIPLKVSPTATNKVKIKAYLNTTTISKEPEITGTNVFEIKTNVDVSHDPNMMAETSDEIGLCTTRGDTIEYRINFQNVGTAPTRYVSVTCSLDDKVDLTKITDIQFPSIYLPTEIRQGSLGGYNVTNNRREATWEIDHNDRTITFEMNRLVLRSVNDPTCTDLAQTRSQVSFKIPVKTNYVFGDPTWGVSSIIFDGNSPIVTDSVFSACIDPIPMDNGGGFQGGNPTGNTGYPVWWYIVGVVAVLALVAVGFVLRRRR